MEQQREYQEEGFVSLFEAPQTAGTVAVAETHSGCDLGSCQDCHKCDCDDCVCHDPCDGSRDE